jgi:hypothetical protein
MTVIRKTPALYASGKYVLTTPFIADPNAVYVCMAIRSFDDILELKEDVFTTYYEPNGLNDTAYQADLAAKVSIITLMSETATIIYVPDSYIESYPDVSNVIYSRIVLSIDLGALPDKLGLEFLKTQLGNQCGDVIGVMPDILVHKSPTTDFISAQENATLESLRVAGITVLKTDYTRNRELLVQVNEQQVIIDRLTQLCIDNNLL